MIVQIEIEFTEISISWFCTCGTDNFCCSAGLLGSEGHGKLNLSAKPGPRQEPRKLIVRKAVFCLPTFQSWQSGRIRKNPTLYKRCFVQWAVAIHTNVLKDYVTSRVSWVKIVTVQGIQVSHCKQGCLKSEKALWTLDTPVFNGMYGKNLDLLRSARQLLRSYQVHMTSSTIN